MLNYILWLLIGILIAFLSFIMLLHYKKIITIPIFNKISEWKNENNISNTTIFILEIIVGIILIILFFLTT